MSQSYEIKTLTLKQILEKALFDPETVNYANSLLDQVPAQSNYLIENSIFLRPCVVQKFPHFNISNSDIRKHISLRYLDSECRLILTPQQSQTVLLLQARLFPQVANQQSQPGYY